MSSIGPDTRLNLAGLDRIGGQALDDLRHPQGLPAREGVQDTAAAGLEAVPAATTDAGEDVLNAEAWDGDGGARMLAGDALFEGRLGAMDLSQAADHAADAILDAFA